MPDTYHIKARSGAVVARAESTDGEIHRLILMNPDGTDVPGMGFPHANIATIPALVEFAQTLGWTVVLAD